MEYEEHVSPQICSEKIIHISEPQLCSRSNFWLKTEAKKERKKLLLLPWELKNSKGLVFVFYRHGHLENVLKL